MALINLRMVDSYHHSRYYMKGSWVVGLLLGWHWDCIVTSQRDRHIRSTETVSRACVCVCMCVCTVS